MISPDLDRNKEWILNHLKQEIHTCSCQFSILRDSWQPIKISPNTYAGTKVRNNPNTETICMKLPVIVGHRSGNIFLSLMRVYHQKISQLAALRQTNTRKGTYQKISGAVDQFHTLLLIVLQYILSGSCMKTAKESLNVLQYYKSCLYKCNAYLIT